MQGRKDKALVGFDPKLVGNKWFQTLNSLRKTPLVVKEH